MGEFIRELFSSGNFMPHAQCFLWYPEIVWLHAVSDIVIALAYFSIPIIILFLLRKNGRFPFKWIYAMFAAFILLCGSTHILAVVVLWEPVYRLQGVFKAMTAIVSIVTAIMILPVLPKIQEMLSNNTYTKKNED